MSSKQKHHVIIGNCIAAVTAADTIRRYGSNDKITIISDEEVPAYSRCLITYYIAGDVTRKHLLSHSKKWYTDRSIDLHLNTKATQVDTKARKVKTATRKSFSYDKRLVATGARPIFFPGADHFKRVDESW